jgi:DMSO/TMAO reductase YedYZ molybdopterin-dependent catalytic subunit
MSSDDLPPDSKLTSSKQQWASQGRGMSFRRAAGDGRLPPGQHVTTGLPVLDLGEQPVIQPEDWQFSVAGAIDVPLKWSWADFMAQPQTTVTVDIHCVTTWSSYDNSFTGVSFRHLMSQIAPRPTARFVMARSFDGYSTNVPMEWLDDDDVLLCHSWNGKPLSREHGGPVRLLVPKLYFWKSAKWLRHMTFMEQDQPGFWEARGYHMRGEPFTEERYG